MKVYIVLRHHVYPEAENTQVADVFFSREEAEKLSDSLGKDETSGWYWGEVVEKEVQ